MLESVIAAIDQEIAKLQQARTLLAGTTPAPVKGGVKVDQCGGAKGSHLGPEIADGIAGARASGA